MPFKIKDNQNDGRYFANGAIFETKRDVCEQLISYHSADCEVEIYEELLKADKVNQCLAELLDLGDWELEDVSGHDPRTCENSVPCYDCELLEN